jgi:hypothetical protein
MLYFIPRFRSPQNGPWHPRSGIFSPTSEEDNELVAGEDEEHWNILAVVI